VIIGMAGSKVADHGRSINQSCCTAEELGFDDGQSPAFITERAKRDIGTIFTQHIRLSRCVFCGRNSTEKSVHDFNGK
jgi:hypothetical protein